MTTDTMNAEQRVHFLINTVIETNKIWILKDEYGCVMLNSEDEDCVPVWPTEQSAQLWATDEWKDCQPEAISLNKWCSRWTHGLLDDDLAVVIYPDENELGMVLYPDEFEVKLKKAGNKRQ